MSDSWQGADSTGTGNWSVPGNWSSGAVPLNTTTVSIGPSVTGTGPWTLSVTDSEAAASVDMEPTTAAGTLSIAGGGTLSVSGNLNVDVNGGSGAVLAVGPGGSLDIAGSLQNYAATTYEVNGGVVSVYGAGNWFDLGTGAVASVQGGGVLNTPGLYIGLFGAADMTVTGASTVFAGTLDINEGTLDVDGNSVVSVGGGGASVGAYTELALGSATIDGAVVDSGTIALPSGGDLAVIDGNLSGTGDLSIAAGATLAVDGLATGLTGPVSMLGGTLDLTQVTYGSGPALGYSTSTGTLTVGTQSLSVGTGLSLSDFIASPDSGTGTLLTEVSCYVAGTRIATEHGEAAVETLQAGDRVRTAGGRIAPVCWVGRATLDLRGQPHAAPVRIAAGAFAPGLPRRDLLVSGDHAIAIGHALVPARKLLNGASIRQDDTLPVVTYVHVELDCHDLLLAEGLAAESFLDTGNRDRFGRATAASHFDGDPAAEVLRIFAEQGCAPLHLGGPVVATVQAHLRARAAALGWRLVSDPALQLEADWPGLQLAPEGPDVLHVVLPPGARWLRLLSRRFVPYEIDPAIPDGRRLGVALAVEIDGASLPEMAFAAGWYAPDAGASWRWTDGAATLALPARPRAATLTLRVVPAGARYWLRGEALAAAAA